MQKDKEGNKKNGIQYLLLLLLFGTLFWHLCGHTVPVLPLSKIKIVGFIAIIIIILNCIEQDNRSKWAETVRCDYELSKVETALITVIIYANTSEPDKGIPLDLSQWFVFMIKYSKFEESRKTKQEAASTVMVNSWFYSCIHVPTSPAVWLQSFRRNGQIQNSLKPQILMHQ